MRSLLKTFTFTLLGSFLLAVHPGLTAQAAEAPAVRDGQHDFDFNIGTWNTHITRILHPLARDSKSVKLEGIVTVRPVWGGKAQLEEIEADGPLGHWQGLTLFLYNPASGQWSQSYSNSQDGTIERSPLTGSRVGDDIELYAQDTLDGRSILSKGLWSAIGPNSHRFEIFVSDDGGASWQPAFIANLDRKS